MPNAVLQRLVDERDETNRNIDRILDVDERRRARPERERAPAHRALPRSPQRARAADRRAARPRRDAQHGPRRTRARSGARAAKTRRSPGSPTPTTPTAATAIRQGSTAPSRSTPATRSSCGIRTSAASVERPVYERAERRMQRVVSQVLTSDIPGIVPTQHIAQIMDTIDASRPLVDASTKSALTSGKIAFPQITERPVVGKQAAEKTTAGDGSMTVTMVEKLAATFLSAANFSWQSIQWSNPDALALWFDLAAADYARKTDAEVGAMLAALDSTPTVVATPDLEGWMAAVAEAAYHVYNADGPLRRHDRGRPRDGLQAARPRRHDVARFPRDGSGEPRQRAPFRRSAGCASSSRRACPRRRRSSATSTRCSSPRRQAPRSSCGQSSRRSAGLRSASSARLPAPSPTQSAFCELTAPPRCRNDRPTATDSGGRIRPARRDRARAGEQPLPLTPRSTR